MLLGSVSNQWGDMIPDIRLLSSAGCGMTIDPRYLQDHISLACAFQSRTKPLPMVPKTRGRRTLVPMIYGSRAGSSEVTEAQPASRQCRRSGARRGRSWSLSATLQKKGGVFVMLRRREGVRGGGKGGHLTMSRKMMVFRVYSKEPLSSSTSGLI